MWGEKNEWVIQTFVPLRNILLWKPTFIFSAEERFVNPVETSFDSLNFPLCISSDVNNLVTLSQWMWGLQIQHRPSTLFPDEQRIPMARCGLCVWVWESYRVQNHESKHTQREKTAGKSRQRKLVFSRISVCGTPGGHRGRLLVWIPEVPSSGVWLSNGKKRRILSSLKKTTSRVVVEWGSKEKNPLQYKLGVHLAKHRFQFNLKTQLSLHIISICRLYMCFPWTLGSLDPVNDSSPQWWMMDV